MTTSNARKLASLINSSGNVLSETVINPVGTFASISTKGAKNVQSLSDLSTVGNTIGEQAFIDSDKDLYIWDGTNWNSISVVATQLTADSDGTVINVTKTEGDISVITLEQLGNLEVTTGEARWYAPYPIKIFKIVSRVDTAPSGNRISMRLNKINSVGVTTFERIIIADSSNKVELTGLDINLTSDDYLTFDIDSIGTTTPGSNLRTIISHYILE